MSHFVQSKTCINDAEVLAKTLKDMGYNPSVNQTKQKVRGHGSETHKAEIILSKEELKDGGDIGFSLDKDGNYEVVMDTYVMRKVNHKQLIKDITMKYSENKIRKIARQNSFNMLSNKSVVNKNGQKVTRLQFVVA